MNIAEILKYCPKGTKLYSTIFGEVIFKRVSSDKNYPIKVKRVSILFLTLMGDACTLIIRQGQCLITGCQVL